jgi:S1-C subfamily serine protease
MAPPEGLLRPPGDDLLRLEARLLNQMHTAKVPEAEQQAVLEALRMLRDIQARGAAAMPEDLEAQVRKYNALSDALRKKLEDLKLPGPGDALPPPARARLGVSVAPPEAGGAPGGGVTVTMVIPKSRGAELGLREGDVIRRINGKAVDDAAALRRTLTDEKQPLVIDLVRKGEPVTLREKAPASAPANPE